MKRITSFRYYLLIISIMCSVNLNSEANININHPSINKNGAIDIDLSSAQQQKMKDLMEGKHIFSTSSKSTAIAVDSTNWNKKIPQYIEVESISLAIDSKKLKIGDSYQLNAIIEPNNATNKTVKWRSYDPDIASIDENGLITANSLGSTKITATSVNDLKASCEITVVDYEPEYKWEGHYNVSSNYYLRNSTRLYPYNFELEIEKVGDELYVTSFLGNDLKKYYDEGYHLQDNGDGTATVNLMEYFILQYTNTKYPIYVIHGWDEENEKRSDYLEFRMNEDGSISISDFDIVSFIWSENDGKWIDGKTEVEYFDINAHIIKEFTYQGVNYVVLDKVENYTHILAENPQIAGSLEYVMVADGKMGICLDENRVYGYLNATSIDEDCIGINHPDSISLSRFYIETAPEGDYYIKDSYGRYLYQTGTYDSFNVSYDLPEEGAIWSIGIDDYLGAKIFNLHAKKFIQFEPRYGTYGSYTDQRGIIPKLYVRIPDELVHTYDRKCMTKPGESYNPGTTFKGDLTIPEIVSNGQEEFTVIAIGNNSFVYNKALTTVVLPHTTLSIGGYAFSGCDNLTSVTIPYGIMTIRYGAFNYSNISSINLPTSLTSIGIYAFQQNYLTDIFIPKNVNNIGRWAFDCETLENIKVDSNNKFYSSLSGVLFDKSLHNIVCFPAGKAGNYTIPYSVRTIKRGAFYNSKISSLNISNSVNNIETLAFHNCDSLCSVTLPSSLKHIYGQPFWYCPNIKNIYYNTTNPIITEESIFNKVMYSKATLYVPKYAIPTFKSTNPWKNFSKIEAYEFKEYPKLLSIKDAIEKASWLENGQNSEPYVIDFEPIVTFVGGGCTYIAYDNSYFAIYDRNLVLEPGQIIRKGWIATLQNYYGQLEFSPTEETTIIGGDILTVPDPVRIEYSSQINRDLLSAVVYIPNVEFIEDTPGDRSTFTGKLKKQHLIFYNNYTVPSQPAGTYDVIATIGSYYDQLEVQPIEYIKANSVDEINTDEPIEYYNLQGQRVMNPDKRGIYIRKKGQTIEKIIIP